MAYRPPRLDLISLCVYWGEVRKKFIILYLTIFTPRMKSMRWIQQLVQFYRLLMTFCSPSMEFLYYVKNWYFHIFLLSSWTSYKLTSALHSRQYCVKRYTALRTANKTSPNNHVVHSLAQKLQKKTRQIPRRPIRSRKKLSLKVVRQSWCQRQAQCTLTFLHISASQMVVQRSLWPAQLTQYRHVQGAGTKWRNYENEPCFLS